MLRPVLPIYVQSYESAKRCTFEAPFPESEFSDVTSIGDKFSIHEQSSLDVGNQRKTVERVSLSILRDHGLGDVIDQFPRLLTFLNQDLNPGDAYLATSKFGKDRATYILECGDKRLVLDTRSAHLTANFNAMASLLLRQPKVAVGDGCALWTFVKGDHLKPGGMVELMMEDSKMGRNYCKDISRNLMFYNLWRDRHPGNYIVSQRGHMTLIDFYSKGSNDGERFCQAFVCQNLAMEFPFFVNDLLRLMIRDKLYGAEVQSPISDVDFEILLNELISAIDSVLNDRLFCQTIQSLISNLDWGRFSTETVSQYYNVDLSLLSARDMIGNALFEQAKNLGFSSIVGSFLFTLSRKF